MFLVLRKLHPAYKNKPINCKISKPVIQPTLVSKIKKKEK